MNHPAEHCRPATEAAAAPAAPSPLRSESYGFARTLIESRHNISPKRLFEPGPTAEELEDLLSLAAAAPDHGLLTPWRFILIPAQQRASLAEVFALALVDRDAGATLEQIESAREKAYRAPTLLVAVARLGQDSADVPAAERIVSLGAAIQNILLGANAMGYGAGLTSGRAMSSQRLGALLELAPGEQAVCCINIGTVGRAKPDKRVRPAPNEFFSVLRGPRRAARRR